MHGELLLSARPRKANVPTNCAILGVIILTYFANLIRVVKLTKVDQFIMAYGGLRGAIAFALAVLLDSGHFKHRRLFITSTVVVVYFTNIAMVTSLLKYRSYAKLSSRCFNLQISTLLLKP